MPPKAPPAHLRLIDPSMPVSTGTLPRGALGSLLPPVRGIEDNITRPPQEATVDLSTTVPERISAIRATPKPPPPLPTRMTAYLQRPWPPRCSVCGMHHTGQCQWANTPRPPQEAPPESESSSYTYSDEDFYWSSDEDAARRIDAVQHGPWLDRSNLPANMQPQDGAFNETLQEAPPEENSRHLRPGNERISRNESMSHMGGHATA